MTFAGAKVQLFLNPRSRRYKEAAASTSGGVPSGPTAGPEGTPTLGNLGSPTEELLLPDRASHNLIRWRPAAGRRAVATKYFVKRDIDELL